LTINALAQSPLCLFMNPQQPHFARNRKEQNVMFIRSLIAFKTEKQKQPVKGRGKGCKETLAAGAATGSLNTALATAKTSTKVSGACLEDADEAELLTVTAAR